MDSRKGFYGTEIIEMAVSLGNALFDSQHGAGGGRSQAANQPWLDGFNLPIEERGAGVNFICLRRAIPRRAALDDVADVNVFTLRAHHLNHFVQQLASPPHKGESLLVFVSARSLPDEYEFRVRIPVSERNCLTGGSKLAAAAITKILADLVQRLRTGRRWRRRLKQIECRGRWWNHCAC